MVGQITAVLTQNRLNIEHMLNHSRGAWAYTLIDLLEQPSQECLDALADIDGVVRVRLIGDGQ